MPSFLTSTSSSASSLGSTTDESQATDDSDGCWKEAATDSDSNHSGACYQIRELGLNSRQTEGDGGAALDGRQQGGALRRRPKRRNSTFGKGYESRMCEARLAAETDRSIGDGSGASRRFFDRVVAVHWVDGGNGNLAGSFPTNQACLASLAGRRNVAIRVHGTPYQWRNSCRPWLAFERDAFLSSLRGFRDALDTREGYPFGTNVGGQSEKGKPPGGTTLSGDTSVATPSSVCSPGGDGIAPNVAGLAWGHCGVKRVLYFENEEPSLNIHFQALRALDPE